VKRNRQKIKGGDFSKVIQANALHIPLKDESVQMVCTSPPYWGLRDYGTATWEGGKNGCDHKVKSARNDAGRVNIDGFHGSSDGDKGDINYSEVCGKCGAKRIDNQLGLEKTPEEYVENTVKWAREVWRVLRKDGCFWLNLGDSYAGSGEGGGGNRKGNEHGQHDAMKGKRPSFRRDKADVIPMDNRASGLKPKDLCEIPSDVVRALRKDGWWLRSRLPWVKRSAMPESCTDRPASALEYVFLLTKSQKYYFDMESIRKGVTGNAHAGRKDQELSPRYGANDMDGHNQRNGTWKQSYLPNSRNFRNTDLFYYSLEEPHGAIFCGDEMVGLDVNPQAYSEAHFATFPEWLVTPLIKAGTSEKGSCPECGAPWERVVEKKLINRNELPKDDPRYRPNRYIKNKYADELREGFECGKYSESKTIGWQPTCKCGIAHPDPTYIPKPLSFVPHEPVPCVVL